MASSSSWDREDAMMDEDLFDGWLSMPTMADFLTDQVPVTVTGSTLSIRVADEQSHERNTAGPARLSVPEIGEADLPYEATDHSRSLDTSVSTISSPTGTPASSIRSGRQRRGHTKSRLGCIDCKKRKVKCQETWPSCANCMKRGNVCRYPVVFKQEQRARIFSEMLRPQPTNLEYSKPNIYSADDMRLFHHYLVLVPPSLALDGQELWTKDLPMYSHRNTYLMHAILALAGSHLDLQMDNAQSKIAIFHRQKALAGLNEAFGQWPPSAEQAHAMLGTTFLLSYQSSFMEDGFVDQIISLRGCALLTQFVSSHKLEGPFLAQATVNMKSHLLDTAFVDFPQLDQELAREALQSIADLAHLATRPTAHSIERALITSFVETIRPLLEADTTPTTDTTTTDTKTCQDSPDVNHKPLSAYSELAISSAAEPAEHQFPSPLFPGDIPLTFEDIDWATITVAPPTGRDPIRSFVALLSTIRIFSTWPYEAVMHVLRPTNQLGNVLMAYFSVVRYIVAPLTAPEAAMMAPIRPMITWLANIVESVHDDDEVKWTQHVAWPRKVLRSLQACLERDRNLTFQVLRDIMLKDPGAFKEGRAVDLSRAREGGGTAASEGD